MKRIVIIGLGLIGGSIAKSLRKVYPDCNIVAVNRSIGSCDSALSEKVINEAYSELSGECLGSMENSDVIFLCTELNSSKEIIDILIKRFNNKKTIITDVCSTKEEIKNIFQNTKYNINYIGGHPMAGSEKSGYKFSSGYLLENAIYILCPVENTNEADIDFMKNIISDIGALPYIMEAKTHDEAMAQISHMPHITAAALVNAAGSYGNREILNNLAAGGFKDITRIASGDPDLWKNISISNRKNIINSIDNLIGNLNEFKIALEKSDKEQLNLLFSSARNNREAYETGRKTIMNLMYELNIDVPDRPGIISEITLKLTQNNINIKNIYIAESRENELGCLRLAFDSKEARDKAAEILNSSY